MTAWVIVAAYISLNEKKYKGEFAFSIWENIFFIQGLKFFIFAINKYDT